MPHVFVKSFQQHKIESDESFVNFGLSDPTEYIFYSLEDAYKPKTRSKYTEPSFVFGYRFGISPDLIKRTRSIYTVLDWLGDVGGLTDALIYIGKALMMIFPGGSFATFLASKLFYSSAAADSDEETRNAKKGIHYMPEPQLGVQSMP